MEPELDTYRERAERFLEELEREYYMHLAGHKPELEIEAVFESFSELFERDVVLALREAREAEPRIEASVPRAVAPIPAGPGPSEGGADRERRRLDQLLQFAVDGHLGRETRAETAELARLEASLEVEAAGEARPYRAVPGALANEPDAGRRAELDAARNEALERHLNPIHRASLERERNALAELGWPSYLDAYEDLRGVSLRALAAHARVFLNATEAAYESIAAPVLAAAGVPELGALQRSDLPRLFRAPALDAAFTEDRLVPSLEQTLLGLGIDLGSQANVHLDTDPRATKSPRAFCATPRVPDEIYLVVAPTGGRDDYAALFHEAGHTEHYAHAEAALPFEFRHLGDNTVTESFAFLLEHLTSDPRWLAEVLGVEDPAPITSHARAVKLLMLRRYAAKIAYEVELHGPGAEFDEMPARYAQLLGGATRVGWPAVTWLADVDSGFYVACYLRAWALETHWRRSLRSSLGERWFQTKGAGEWLRGLWSEGQRRSGDELLAGALGEELDLRALGSEFAAEREG